jgi:hypothetical protein
MMAIRDEHGTHPYVVGNDAGYFCPKCPTVVLDKEEFTDFGIRAFGNNPRAQFAVIGIVDLEAILEDKRSRPLGEDDNPIPFVKFIREPAVDTRQPSKAKAKKKRRDRRRGKGR